MPSPNNAKHIDRPSKHAREEAEETARDILGPKFINAPTVKVILKLQATRMNPLEWVSVKEVLQREPEAATNLFLLACLLDDDAEDAELENSEVKAAILQVQELSIRDARAADLEKGEAMAAILQAQEMSVMDLREDERNWELAPRLR